MLAALFKGLSRVDTIFEWGKSCRNYLADFGTGLWAQTVPRFEVADVRRSDRAMNPLPLSLLPASSGLRGRHFGTWP